MSHGKFCFRIFTKHIFKELRNSRKFRDVSEFYFGFTHNKDVYKNTETMTPEEVSIGNL